MMPLRLDGLVTDGDWYSWAIMSPDHRYRYALGRSWEPGPGRGLFDEATAPVLAIVMLNPSTADHSVDDPTIRRVIHFARQEGCGGVLVRNLAAWRATDPAELAHVEDPVGPRNLEVLRLGPFFALHVAAWGAFKDNQIRRRLLPSILEWGSTTTNPLVLGLTKRGEPRHPLFLPKTQRVMATLTPTSGVPLGVRVAAAFGAS